MRFRQLQTSKTFRNRERSRGVPDAPSTASGRNPEDGDADDGHQANEGFDSSRMRRVECLERARAGGDRRASRVRHSTASARRKSVTKRESGRGRERGVRDLLVALLSSADMAVRAASSHHMLALFLRGRGGPGARKRVACGEEWHAESRKRAFISVVMTFAATKGSIEGSGDERTSNHLGFSRERFGRSLKSIYFETAYLYVVFVNIPSKEWGSGIERFFYSRAFPRILLVTHCP